MALGKRERAAGGYIALWPHALSQREGYKGKGVVSPGERPQASSWVGRGRVLVRSELPQRLDNCELLSPFPLCAVAVSVTVGGKQYLLGLYDTAGQVSVLAPGLHPFPFPSSGWLRRAFEAEVSRREGVSAERPFGSSLLLFSSQQIRKRKQQTQTSSPQANPWAMKVFACVCLLHGAWCVGPNSCCKVAVANGEASLFLVADDQVSPHSLCLLPHW